MNFDTLDSVKNDETKASVECVAIPGLIKISAILEGIVVVLIEVQVAAQPVVAGCFKMGDKDSFVALEATRSEQVRLLLVSQSFLRYSVITLQTRKEPPKCA